jgi:hypothetical protein
MTFAPVIKEGTYRDPDDGKIYKTNPHLQEGWRGWNPDFTTALNKAKMWQQLSSASQDYSQSGTDIPNFSEGSGGAYSAGSNQSPQGFGYQYQSPSNVAMEPSFDVMGPDIDSPIVDKWIKERQGPRLPMPTPEQLQQRMRQLRNSLVRPV